MSDDLDVKGIFLPDDGTDPLLDDAIAQPTKAKAAPPSRSKKPYGKVNLRSLQDPRFNVLYTPTGRLYHRLEIETRRGTRRVSLTNGLAAEVGVLRQHKARYLRELEAMGLVTVVAREGNQVPLVAVHPPPE
jgi:hypothetical protein